MMFWDNWTKYWEAALAACAAQPGEPRTSAKGKTLPRLVVASPATPSEIEQVEQNLGLHLPSAFRNVLMQFSRCVDVAWQLPAGFKPPGELRRRPIVACPADIDLDHEAADGSPFFEEGNDVVAVVVALVIALLYGGPGGDGIDGHSFFEDGPAKRHLFPRHSRHR